MPTSQNQKSKLLYLMKILLDKTDEQHPLTIAEIKAELSAYDIGSERKSLYDDIELLRRFGLDIETLRDKTTRYYIASRRFELPELKLLVDAVQSSRFISGKKSEALVRKLSSLTSEAQAGQLRRQVYVAGRAKAMNESVYYSIDQIHSAIGAGKKISFKYFDYDVKKKRVYRRNGETYLTTPVTLCWNDDNYYLIAYSAKYDGLTHYRVDRMIGASVSEDAADAFDRVKFSVAEHVRRVFGMYGGEPIRATLSFDADLVNVVLDHFGKDIVLASLEEGRFEVMAEVSVSPVFLAWMFQFGERAEIKAPDSLRAAMRELLDASAKKYSSE
jgi:predicted DNA-binding transcriptional regulator YafY